MAGLVGVPSRVRSPDPRPRVHSRDSQSQSESRTTPPLDRGNNMGVSLPLKGDRKGTLTLDRRVDSTKCQGVKQEGLDVTARWAKFQHNDN